MSEQHEPLISAPSSLSKRFLPFTVADKVVLTIVVFWTLLLNARFDTLGVLLGIGVGVVMLWSWPWGKTYDRAITQIYDAVTSLVYQNTFWENTELLKSQGVYKRPARWRLVLQAFFRRAHPYPIRIDWMNDDYFGEVGLGFNQLERTDSVVLLSEGSDVLRKEPATKLSMLMAFSDAVKRMSGKVPVRVTLIVRPRPPDVEVFERAVDDSHHPEAVVPSARLVEVETGLDAEALYRQGLITREELRWARLNEVVIADPRESYANDGQEVDYAVVLTIPRDPRASKAARRRGGKPLSATDVRKLPLTRVLKVAYAALQNLGAEDLRILNRQELEQFCADYRLNDAGKSEPDIPPHHPRFGIYGDRGASVIDGVVHVAYRVAEMPTRLHLDDIARLATYTSPRATLAVMGERSSGKKEGAGFYWLEAVFDAATDNMRLGKSIQHGRAKLDQSSDQIVAGGGIHYVNILLVVRGKDADEVATDCDTLIREAGALGFQLDRVPGSLLQLRVALAATTGMARV